MKNRPCALSAISQSREFDPLESGTDLLTASSSGNSWDRSLSHSRTSCRTCETSQDGETMSFPGCCSKNSIHPFPSRPKRPADSRSFRPPQPFFLPPPPLHVNWIVPATCTNRPSAIVGVCCPREGNRLREFKCSSLGGHVVVSLVCACARVRECAHDDDDDDDEFRSSGRGTRERETTLRAPGQTHDSLSKPK